LSGSEFRPLIREAASATSHATHPVPTTKTELISRYNNTAGVATDSGIPPPVNAKIIATSITPKPPGSIDTLDAVMPARYAASRTTRDVLAFATAKQHATRHSRSVSQFSSADAVAAAQSARVHGTQSAAKLADPSAARTER
jgi:hypothetical protein